MLGGNGARRGIGALPRKPRVSALCESLDVAQEVVQILVGKMLCCGMNDVPKESLDLQGLDEVEAPAASQGEIEDRAPVAAQHGLSRLLVTSDVISPSVDGGGAVLARGPTTPHVSVGAEVASLEPSDRTSLMSLVFMSRHSPTKSTSFASVRNRSTSSRSAGICTPNSCSIANTSSTSASESSRPPSIKSASGAGGLDPVTSAKIRSTPGRSESVIAFLHRGRDPSRDPGEHAPPRRARATAGGRSCRWRSSEAPG